MSGPASSAIPRALGSTGSPPWRIPLVALLLLILFVPIRRYTMPVDLPFQLEPYRLFVAMLAGAWVLALLADPSTRLRRSGLETPLLCFVAAALASVLVNTDRIIELELDADVLKALTFFASFVFVFYFVVSVVRTQAMVDLVVRVLVLGAGVVAITAIVESRSGYNLFDHLDGAVPLLDLAFPADIKPRGARLRAFASAQHPIALAALLVMVIPLAVYLARKRRVYWLVAGVLALGAISTVSRTSIVMLAVVFFVFLWLRPRETARISPILVPLVVAVQLSMPGTLGTLRAAFFPSGGLVEEQSAAGRIEDFAPSRKEIADRPLLGEGYGTRRPSGENANTRILDNEWLGTMLETGLVGTLSLLWLFIRFIRRSSRSAKEDDTDRGWLLVSITASVTAFAIGMFTYDAFSFIQVTFLLYILLGLGSVLVGLGSREVGAGAPRRQA